MRQMNLLHRRLRDLGRRSGDIVDWRRGRRVVSTTVIKIAVRLDAAVTHRLTHGVIPLPSTLGLRRRVRAALLKLPNFLLQRSNLSLVLLDAILQLKGLLVVILNTEV